MSDKHGLTEHISRLRRAKQALIQQAWWANQMPYCDHSAEKSPYVTWVAGPSHTFERGMLKFFVVNARDLQELRQRQLLPPYEMPPSRRAGSLYPS